MLGPRKLVVSRHRPFRARRDASTPALCAAMLTGLLAAGVFMQTGCEQRVVKAKGIGTDHYAVEPDAPSKPAKRVRPVGPTPNPTMMTPIKKSRPMPSSSR